MRKFIVAGTVSMLAFGIITALVSAGPFRNRGGGGGCGPNGCDVGPGPEPERVTWEWKACDLPHGDNRFVLWRNGQFHGFWDATEKVYRAHLGAEEWGAKVASAPRPLPSWINFKAGQDKPSLPPLEQWQLDGVDAEKIDGKEETTYSINGVPVTQEQADKKLIEDDSHKLWLIVNGTGREKVIADLKADPSFAGLLKRTRVWSVPADHFSLLDRDTKKPMFLNSGNPSITFMAADRTVLFEKDGYQGPADLEALRRADPEAPKPPPNPKKRDPAKPDDPLNPSPSIPFNAAFPLCCVAAVGGLWFLNRKAGP